MLAVTEKPNNGYRTVSEKDYDKIVFCQAFRRLAHKTQVHPLAENDHVHNRMSHSIEVSSVCKSLVSKLVFDGIIPAKVENNAISTIMAAGLGHDMGNPPFGHIGEESISKWVELNKKELLNVNIDQRTVDTYLSYDGNAQNYHIFTNYEYFKQKPVSNPTIATMVKYPVVSSKDNPKSGYFAFEEEHFIECFNSLGLYKNNKYIRHPLSFLLESADDICYAIMDIDDAIEMGILQTSGTEFVKIMEMLFGFKTGQSNSKDFREKRGAIIGNAINEIADVYTDNADKIMEGAIPFKTDLLKLSNGNHKTLKAIKQLKILAKHEVFKNRRKVQFETASYAILHRILDQWFIAFSDYAIHKWKIEECDTRTKKIFQLLDMYDPILKMEPKIENAGLIQIIDYVSGCTDRFANEVSLSFLGIIK